ncbi:MAG: SPOR domain-containing protein [Prolixibacteraceae bacterium]|nr:SPOR domain-containing protein [Prolixibacteraceae bacterium]MBT6006354.1 SPOR domain-containing protein [Prolixibacteraceae bacterium]MBT6766992.1 SPOR domain-containing protein [Prolixibacteraceae bacterium]MBT6997940.1 SPOR domain-containing protein [Prolixibacteraceae bacterium]MBT7396050.1 SPOR domain-containing protein [Prolixibacteraceae bacterium]
MKGIIIITIVFALVFIGCKTTKQPAQSPYTSDNTEQPKVFSVPETSTETLVKEEPKVVEEKPIAVRKEQVTFTKQEDKTQNETNTFFVIIGSFSKLENAKNFRNTLLGEGFIPIVLHSETGYYRVCINSFKNEQEARNRISDVRKAFPKYSDIWLLFKE